MWLIKCTRMLFLFDRNYRSSKYRNCRRQNNDDWRNNSRLNNICLYAPETQMWNTTNPVTTRAREIMTMIIPFRFIVSSFISFCDCFKTIAIEQILGVKLLLFCRNSFYDTASYDLNIIADKHAMSIIVIYPDVFFLEQKLISRQFST